MTFFPHNSVALIIDIVRSFVVILDTKNWKFFLRNFLKMFTSVYSESQTKFKSSLVQIRFLAEQIRGWIGLDQPM